MSMIGALAGFVALASLLRSGARGPWRHELGSVLQTDQVTRGQAARRPRATLPWREPRTSARSNRSGGVWNPPRREPPPLRWPVGAVFCAVRGWLASIWIPWPGGPARWASRRDLSALIVSGPVKRRVILGRLASVRSAGGHPSLLAVESGHSLLVVGPTQSGKTTGLAIPAVIEWEGPVVAASVKSDLVLATMGCRSELGGVQVYDPTGVTGFRPALWSPLTACFTWAGARHMAAGMAEVAREDAGTLDDGAFWYATAAKLLAPLFHAAAISGRTMSDVVRWVDRHEVEEVAEALEGAGALEALQAAEASWGRDERQMSSVYTTAETVIEVFADPGVAASAGQAIHGVSAGVSAGVGAVVDPGGHEDTNVTVDPVAFLSGPNTLYLCSPAHGQRRLRPLFSTLVGQLIEVAFERASRTGAPVDPPLLVVLDEAANVAPLAELDVLASTAAGHGVHLVTIWQDLAQIGARYGARSGSVVNNHRAKLFLPGITDPGTLEHASLLAGDCEKHLRATTVGRGGDASTTDQLTSRRLLPPDELRRLRPGSGLLLYGHLPPAIVHLRCDSTRGTGCTPETAAGLLSRGRPVL